LCDREYADEDMHGNMYTSKSVTPLEDAKLRELAHSLSTFPTDLLMVIHCVNNN